MWADSIFGIDVAVRELNLNQEITPTYERLPEIAKVYSSIGGDDTNLNKQMSKGILMYYSTALLWTRLLDNKTNLSFVEQEFIRAMMTQEYNVPQMSNKDNSSNI